MQHSRSTINSGSQSITLECAVTFPSNFIHVRNWSLHQNGSYLMHLINLAQLWRTIPYLVTPIGPNAVASPVQIHQSVQMLWKVLFRYINPSKCCGKSCSYTSIRPNAVESPVQIHQTVQMLWQVLLRYTNPAKCCGKSCSDTSIRPNAVASPV